MKRIYFLILSFATLYTSYTLLAMDFHTDFYKETLQLLENQYPQTPEELIANVNASIDKHFQYKNNFFSSRKFTEEEHFNLLNIVDMHYGENIDNQIIINLKKNNFFMNTINYFCDLAKKNIDRVTYNTLETVTNPQMLQSIQQLNKLSLAIKKYVMDRAYNNIVHTYPITFSGHTAKVRCADVNYHKNLVASASNDTTFRLWNFQTGAQIKQLPEKANHGYVKFNSDGSLLATATCHQKEPQEIHIKIWDTKSFTLLHTIKRSDWINGIEFSLNNRGKNLLFIFDQFGLKLYKLKKEIPNPRPYTCAGHITIDPHCNTSLFVTHKNGTFTIQKTSRNPQLYLCKCAVHNTKDIESLQSIKQTSIYKNMKEYEQGIIEKQLNEKCSSLSPSKQTFF